MGNYFIHEAKANVVLNENWGVVTWASWSNLPNNWLSVETNCEAVSFSDNGVKLTMSAYRMLEWTDDRKAFFHLFLTFNTAVSSEIANGLANLTFFCRQRTVSGEKFRRVSLKLSRLFKTFFSLRGGRPYQRQKLAKLSLPHVVVTLNIHLLEAGRSATTAATSASLAPKTPVRIGVRHPHHHVPLHLRTEKASASHFPV